MKALASARRTIPLLAVLLLLVTCAPRQTRAPVEQHFTYAGVPIDLQIEESDIIFAGTITGISGTRWNQDSGEYWEERVQDETGDTLHTGLPYYTIELLVDVPIVGDTRSGETLVVTQVGMSPGDQEVGNADGSARLQVGDYVMMFVRHSEMGWRDGTRPILGPFTVPESSCFVRGDDGLYETAQLTANREGEKRVTLDQLTERISRVRGIQVQSVGSQP